MISDQERQERRNFVGASDVPALFGQDSFKTVRDIWLSKVEEGDFDEPKQGSARWYGNYLEPPVAQMMIEKVIPEGAKILESPPAFVHGVLRANLDVWADAYTYRKKVIDENVNIEIKTTGFKGEPPDFWGRGGTDKIPNRVALQVHAQMLCSQTSTSFVGCLFGTSGWGLKVYRIKKNHKYEAEILKRAEKFWRKYVEPKKDPGDIPYVE